MTKNIILGLLASLLIASGAQAKDVLITSLPFIIAAPGNYTLTPQAVASYHPDGLTPAITISDPGATTATSLDLNGLTLDGQKNPNRLSTPGVTIAGGINNVTVKNGRIQGGPGIQAGDRSTPTLAIHSLTIKGIFFNDSTGVANGVTTVNVFGSVIKDCTFQSENGGINDLFSPGDEQFLDNTMIPLGGEPDNMLVVVPAQARPYVADYRSTPLTTIPSASTVPTIAAANSRNIQITSLPFIIAAPGNYTLTPQAVTSYHPDGVTPAITINDLGATTPTSLDLNGLVLDYGNLGLPIFTTAVIKIFGGVKNVTVKNGAIKNVMGACIQEGGFANDTGVGSVHSATINGITFFNYEIGVVTVGTFGSVIKNCVFIGDGLAIRDRPSPSDEQFINNTFVPNNTSPVDQAIFIGEPSFYLLDYRSTPLNTQIPTP